MLRWLTFLFFRLKGFDHRPEAIIFILFFNLFYNGVKTYLSKFLSAKAVIYDYGDVRLTALQQRELRHDFAPPVLLSHSRCFLIST